MVSFYLATWCSSVRLRPACCTLSPALCRPPPYWCWSYQSIPSSGRVCCRRSTPQDSINHTCGIKDVLHIHIYVLPPRAILGWRLLNNIWRVATLSSKLLTCLWKRNARACYFCDDRWIRYIWFFHLLSLGKYRPHFLSRDWYELMGFGLR